MLLDIINLITLAILAYIDYMYFKIPNIILCGWLGTLIYLKYICGTIPEVSIPKVIVFLIVPGSYILLRRIVRCSAGDFKLFLVIAVAIGFNNMLVTLLITCLISIIPLASGLKRIPMAFIAYFGYIAFLLLRSKSIV